NNCQNQKSVRTEPRWCHHQAKKKKPGVAAPVGHAKHLLATTPTKATKNGPPARPGPAIATPPNTAETVATACLTLTRKNEKKTTTTEPTLTPTPLCPRTTRSG
ncbi:unnamed protein product, partial [Ectocarpus sp. 13 AM-2016]